jgi:YceI-like domain
MKVLLSMMLSMGSATYHVQYTLKKVEATSKEVKGKIMCPTEECEFLLAVPLKSFESSDSNRDLNMQMTTEADKFPLATAKGKFHIDELKKDKTIIQAQVEMHGITKTYPVTLEKQGSKASFKLDLEAHKIERPSLFGIKIKNEVPMDFDLKWSK